MKKGTRMSDDGTARATDYMPGRLEDEIEWMREMRRRMILAKATGNHIAMNEAVTERLMRLRKNGRLIVGSTMSKSDNPVTQDDKTSTEFIDELAASMRRGVEENRDRLGDIEIPEWIKV